MEDKMEDYIDGFWDFAIYRAVEMGILSDSEELEIPNIKDSYEAFWVGLDEFVNKQFKEKYPHQLNIAPIVSGQLCAYAGMCASYLLNNQLEKIIVNVLEGHGKSKISEDLLAAYKLLDINFKSQYSYDVNQIIKQSDDIEDVEEFFTNIFGVYNRSEEEIKLRGAFNNIFADIWIKVHEEARKRHFIRFISIRTRIMNLMFKFGLAVGMKKFVRRYNIIAYGDGWKKNPPRLCIFANPIPYGKNTIDIKDVDFEVNKEKSICFLFPYEEEYYKIIDDYLCEKEDISANEWIPQMDLFEIAKIPVMLKEEVYKTYIHKALIEEIEHTKIVQ